VRHILEGSVRKDGDTVRITAQLIDASGDRHLWSQTFDRPLTTGALFAVQDEISVAIVAALSEALDIEVEAPASATVLTENMNSYEAFLEARNLFRARSNFVRIEQLLDRAVTLDPNFAAAWALRAAGRILAGGYGQSESSLADTNRLALDYIRRTLAIDPANAQALAVRGFVRQSENYASITPLHDWAEIAADYDAALIADPENPEALNWRGRLMDQLGFPDEARDNFRQCIEADPFYVSCHANYCDQLVAEQDIEGALNCHREALARDLILSPGIYLSLFAHIGDERAFMMTLSDSRIFPGWHRNDEVYQAFRDQGGDHSALIALLEAHFDTLPDDRYRARLDSELFVPLGRDTTDTFVRWGPIYSGYRRSTVFRRYIEQSGVLAYWQTYGFPPQCRSVGDDDFECD
jgi:tetratricopeptide (TPR) repeat protein